VLVTRNSKGQDRLANAIMACIVGHRQHVPEVAKAAAVERHIDYLFLRWAEEYGPVFSVRLLMRMHIVADPVAMQQASRGERRGHS
jgi:hypothetical protein